MAGVDPIADQFAGIHSMFGNVGKGGSGGGGSSGGGSGNSGSVFSPEPIKKPSGLQVPGFAKALDPILGLFGSSGDDSLTIAMKQLTNLLGTSGQDTLSKGGNILDQGNDILGTGLNLTDAGVQDLQAPLQYWEKLLSGDQQAMTEATAPEAQALTDANDAALRAAETQGPAGGYRSSTLANLPFSKARDIATLQQKLRPQAATNVTNIAQIMSQLGLSEQNVGQAQEGIGISEQGMGLQELQAALQGLLARRGQNVQSTGQTMSLIGNLLGTLLANSKSGGSGGGAG